MLTNGGLMWSSSGDLIALPGRYRKRSLIVERVRAGLRNPKTNGHQLGRPRVTVDAAEIARLRSQGATWRAISQQLGVGVGTLCRVAAGPSKTRRTDLGTR